MRRASVLRGLVFAAALAAPLAAPMAAQAPPVAPGAPAAVAQRFLQAFEKKDFQAIRALFAPGAVVSTVNLERNGPPTVAYKTLDEWIVQAEKELAPVTFTRVETLDTSALSFDQGATVSVRFRATGKAGNASFTNNGIDTYSLTLVDGDWRILRYGTFELLEFH